MSCWGGTACTAADATETSRCGDDGSDDSGCPGVDVVSCCFWASPTVVDAAVLPAAAAGVTDEASGVAGLTGIDDTVVVLLSARRPRGILRMAAAKPDAGAEAQLAEDALDGSDGGVGAAARLRLRGRATSPGIGFA